jgi:segregation and condensation protein A
LLFHLIEKNQFNIYDIPINIITDQYMEYLFAMQELDLEIASEFLVMAATLLHIKSRMLLPERNQKEPEETDPREELVMRLLEYRKFKDLHKCPEAA